MTNLGLTTNYVWDRASSLPALVDDGTLGYVQTDQGVLEQLGSTSTYPLSDALGSVRTVEAPTPSALGTASYDVFGSVRSQSGQQSIFGFTGQQSDPTGLSFLRARYFNPSLGRFISQDTVQPNAPGSQGYNFYSYVANNPTTVIDPSGHAGIGELAARLVTTITVSPGAFALGVALVAGLHLLATAFLCQVRIVPNCQLYSARDQTWPRGPAMAKPDLGTIKKLADATAKVVAACLASGLASSATEVGSDVNPCNRLPANTYLPGKDTTQTTGHIKDAIEGNAQANPPITPHPQWAYLVRGTNGTANRQWYPTTSGARGSEAQSAGVMNTRFSRRRRAE
jgi:RHS repeat-associated protein